MKRRILLLSFFEGLVNYLFLYIHFYSGFSHFSFSPPFTFFIGCTLLPSKSIHGILYKFVRCTFVSLFLRFIWFGVRGGRTKGKLGHRSSDDQSRGSYWGEGWSGFLNQTRSNGSGFTSVIPVFSLRVSELCQRYVIPTDVVLRRFLRRFSGISCMNFRIMLMVIRYGSFWYWGIMSRLLLNPFPERVIPSLSNNFDRVHMDVRSVD